MITALFFISIAAIFYIYFGYPICVYILAFIKQKYVNKQDCEPFVSILIAAFNEEDCIEQTIQNKLNLDYPDHKYEIIVISDESTDLTDEIVAKFESPNIRLIRQVPRAGKTSALNLAVPQAKGEILVFSDANSIYDSGALRKIVANFSDQDVGYVSGKMIYTDADGSVIGDGCSAYMKYENFLRSIETKIGSIVGVDGGIDAVRKKLYQPMNNDQLPDFVLPLKVVQQGYRAVYEPEALLKEHALKEPEDEYRMRVRVSLRAMWALYDMKSLLSLKRYRIFAWQMLSHKVLRYLCFIFIITGFVSNLLLLSESIFYKVFFAAQILSFIGVAISAYLQKNRIEFKPLYFLYYFFLLNTASAHAFLKFIMGKKMVTWTPRKG